MQEIPVSFRKRPRQIVPLPLNVVDDAASSQEGNSKAFQEGVLSEQQRPQTRAGSALQIKFKKPKTLSTTNPLEFLSEIAAMDSSEERGNESQANQTV